MGAHASLQCEKPARATMVLCCGVSSIFFETATGLWAVTFEVFEVYDESSTVQSCVLGVVSMGVQRRHMRQRSVSFATVVRQLPQPLAS